ncbi:uncharacterized protein LOC130614675 [Hydractinia symbiolongicarpus]|uniref:uncharacterized protein LOC130614675 n=1 Tax=Hydractinia symbiolongicarpus TaxID=13093 RepID=UPI00254B99D1|nr:uncharacterized protein LOC130614675 [Hydractinia symbiolongicarpus]
MQVYRMNSTEEIVERVENSNFISWAQSASSITVLTLSVMFNSLGVYLLMQLKSPRHMNQIYILMSMSFSEVLLGVVSIIYVVTNLSGYERESSSQLSLYCEEIITGLTVTYYIILFMLTLDRLLACVLLLQYPRIATTKRTLLCLSGAWVIGVIVAFPFFFYSPDTFYEIRYKYIYISLDGIILAAVFITYSYIFHKTSRKHRTTSSTVQRRGKMFFVITIITATFILLLVIPDILYAYRFVIHDIGSDVEMGVIMFCWELNYLADPCVYIFLQKNVRAVLRRKIADIHRKNCLTTCCVMLQRKSNEVSLDIRDQKKNCKIVYICDN